MAENDLAVAPHPVGEQQQRQQGSLLANLLWSTVIMLAKLLRMAIKMVIVVLLVIHLAGILLGEEDNADSSASSSTTTTTTAEDYPQQAPGFSLMPDNSQGTVESLYGRFESTVQKLVSYLKVTDTTRLPSELANDPYVGFMSFQVNVVGEFAVAANQTSAPVEKRLIGQLSSRQSRRLTSADFDALAEAKYQQRIARARRQKSLDAAAAASGISGDSGDVAALTNSFSVLALAWEHGIRPVYIAVNKFYRRMAGVESIFGEEFDSEEDEILAIEDHLNNAPLAASSGTIGSTYNQLMARRTALKGTLTFDACNTDAVPLSQTVEESSRLAHSPYEEHVASAAKKVLGPMAFSMTPITVEDEVEVLKKRAEKSASAMNSFLSNNVFHAKAELNLTDCILHNCTLFAEITVDFCNNFRCLQTITNNQTGDVEFVSAASSKYPLRSFVMRQQLTVFVEKEGDRGQGDFAALAANNNNGGTPQIEEELSFWVDTDEEEEDANHFLDDAKSDEILASLLGYDTRGFGGFEGDSSVDTAKKNTPNWTATNTTSTADESTETLSNEKPAVTKVVSLVQTSITLSPIVEDASYVLASAPPSMIPYIQNFNCPNDKAPTSLGVPITEAEISSWNMLAAEQRKKQDAWGSASEIHHELVSVRTMASYRPVTFVNNFWVLESDLRELPSHDTVQKRLVLPKNTAHTKETAQLVSRRSRRLGAFQNFTLSIQPLTLPKFMMYAQFESSTWLNMSRRDLDIAKRMFEVNPYFLALTGCVAVFCTVFNFLDFINDVTFWRTRSKTKDYKGISLRTVAVNCYFQTVVLLHLIDAPESIPYRIMLPSFFSLLLEFWKLKGTVRWVKRDAAIAAIIDSNGNIDEVATAAAQSAADAKEQLGVLVSLFGYKLAFNKSYANNRTSQYDKQAISFLMNYVLLPGLLLYSLYSANYHGHRGWYSFLIQCQWQYIHFVGFIMMAPQIFINYKMKSAVPLLWRTFIFKFFSTITDDLLAFVLPMPALQRLACFCDDIVFVILLYQRWAYRVDKPRDRQGDDDEGGEGRRQQ